MKNNAIDTLRGLGADELNAKMTAGAEQMFRIRFQMSMGNAEGLKKYRELRKERARLLTFKAQTNQKEKQA
jgi:large subunit ribosomal protein L29